MEHISVILTGFFSLLATSLAAWFAYNQHTKNKLTDLKMETIKKENEVRYAADSRSIAIIYGSLWGLLNKLDVDRCYILQPHPNMKHYYLSINIEVNKNGVSFVREIIQNFPISEVPDFTKELGTNCWIFYDNIEEQVKDARAKSIMKLVGPKQIAIKQLVNIRGEWVGSLIASSIKESSYNEVDLCKEMKNVANVIQFILPPIN